MTGLLTLFLVGLIGCVYAPARVSTEVIVRCEAPFHQYATFKINVNNAPGFLEQYLRQGLAQVLENKGLVPTQDSNPDLLANVDFKQVFLSSASEDNDAFGGSADSAVVSRFMAAVTVDVIATDTRRIVWSVRLSRIHSTSHGQPRGNDHKMQGIIDGFSKMYVYNGYMTVQELIDIVMYLQPQYDIIVPEIHYRVYP